MYVLIAGKIIIPFIIYFDILRSSQIFLVI